MLQPGYTCMHELCVHVHVCVCITSDMLQHILLEFIDSHFNNALVRVGRAAL